MPKIDLRDAGLDFLKGLKLHDLLRRSAEKWPDKEALVDEEKRITYCEFDQLSNRLANGLVNAGLQKGDKAAMLIENCVEFAVIFTAILKSGAVVVPIFPRLGGQELEYILNHAEAKVLFLNEAAIPRVEQVLHSFRYTQSFIAQGKVAPDWATPLESLYVENGEQAPEIEMKGEDLAVIQYTSGTTGRPKGVMLSHRAAVVNTEQLRYVTGANETDRFPVLTALYHVSAARLMWMILHGGGTVVIAKAYHTIPVLEMMEKEKITSLFAVPAMMILMMEEMEQKHNDLSGLRWIIYGAAVMPYEAIKRARRFFPGAKLYNIYGQTENAPGMTSLDNQYALTKEGSVGVAFPGARVRVVDKNDVDCPPRVVGEIITQTASFMSGYYKDPELTQNSTRGGWYHSKDMGFLDEEGFLYIVDRKDDMINRGGENIYPAEVEGVIYQHTGVLEVAVIGVPDKVMGEEVKAFIVPKEEIELNVDDVRQFCKQHLSSYKVPRYIEICRELPKTSTGMKISKPTLRQTT